MYAKNLYNLIFINHLIVALLNSRSNIFIIFAEKTAKN